MPRPAESHSRGEQSVCISVDKCVHVRVSLHIASCARECLGACTPERVCDFSRRDECVWHQCVFSIKGEIKPKKLRMTIHTEAANRGLTQILQEPSPLFFFFCSPLQNRNICRPASHLYARHGSKHPSETVEHKQQQQQQQPHNEAVNKEDVSTSLCFPAKKQNGFRMPFGGK